MVQHVTRLKNELIVFIPDRDWTPELLSALKASKTPQIGVDDVIHLITPFGSHLLCLQMCVTRARATTHDLRVYLHRTLVRLGLDVELTDIHAPGHAQLYRA